MCDQTDSKTSQIVTTTTQAIQNVPCDEAAEPKITTAANEAVAVLMEQKKNIPNENETYEITAPNIIRGHTFLVTTVVSETVTTTTTTTENKATDNENQTLKAVLVPSDNKVIGENDEATVELSSSSNELNAIDSNDYKAVVPISSSLPSKLLRFHAKRTAHALLQQAEQHQSESLDSQFGSDEDGACGGNIESNTSNEDVKPSAPPMSPSPLVSLGEDEKLIDVGMGSSIEDSEESEEDDELKPLAVDNHMLLLDVELGSPTESPEKSIEVSNSSVLSEANLERFHQTNRQQQQQIHHHHHQMDNIYLHPNFRYELDDAQKDIPECSPPPAVAPANSPIEQRRIHRSFLTMKKPAVVTSDPEVDSTNSVKSHLTDQNSEHTAINEVDTLDPTLVPNDELASEIAEAVEFYFSNESILKDAFLLKHVRRNKEGFVSLKLVSSFKRVRQLTKDWKVVGNAVRRKSHKIELNDIGTKVRRIDALPNFDETMPSRTIVACDLPLEKLTIEKVSDIFSKCGEIALIRILKPGMAIPVDVRQFMNKFPEMQQKDCALVEFLESSSARKARDLQGPFQVFEMVAPKKKTGKKAVLQVTTTPVTRMVENYRYINDATYERTRGGSFSGIVPHHDVDLRFKLKRNNSDFNPKAANTAYADMQQQQHQYYQQQQQQQQQHYHHPTHHHAVHQQQHHNPTHRGSFGMEHSQHHYQNYQPRNSLTHETVSTQSPISSPSANNNMNFFAYSPRRYSNISTISANTANSTMNDSPQSPVTSGLVHSNSNTTTNQNAIINSNNNAPVRRISNCSDNFSNYSEMSRRPSNCSETAPQRRDSNCSDNCPCSRRVSDFAPTSNEVYRKTSQGSIGSGVSGGGVVERNISERRFSNGSIQFERTFSSGSTDMNVVNGNSFPRRMSNDFNYERRQSLETQTGSPYDDGTVGGGGGGYMVFPRRYSNNFNNISSKLAAYDNAQYINGRRISTDSGYDRRYSFGSEYEGSPRSRTGSFINNYKNGIDLEGQPRSRTNSFLEGSPRSRSGSFAQRNVENLVRTPIGPDGSKGFNVRARKFGQTISPVN